MGCLFCIVTLDGTKVKEDKAFRIFVELHETFGYLVNMEIFRYPQLNLDFDKSIYF